MSAGMCVDEYKNKKVVCPKKYFQKKKKKKNSYQILNHLYFGSNFIFWETALKGILVSFFFFSFSTTAVMAGNNFLAKKHHTKQKDLHNSAKTYDKITFLKAQDLI